MLTTLYNSFINRYLAGEVESAFPCTAYVLNTKYADMDNTKYYARNISDFNALSAGSLYVNNSTMNGSFLSSGYEIENTYYRVLETEDETNEHQPLVISNDNLSAFSSMLTVNGVLPPKYQEYIDKYYYFYLVSRNDEFSNLAKRVKNCEHFAVVLNDDIDNIVVNGNVFGTSEQHPFRGTFDGNGFTISISNINANTVSNGLFGYIANEGLVQNLRVTNASNTQNITVNSTTEISLTTIKQGKGDYKYGVLAGTNYGTIRNVILDADIIYTGVFRPSVYFIQNKTGYNSLVSDAWQRINALDDVTTDNALLKVSNLTDFTNICFPTQLCLNSKANVSPYVGYFGEGVFAYEFGVALEQNTTIYRYDNPIRFSDTSRDIPAYTTAYNADVYQLYLDKHPVVNPDGDGTRYYEGNYTKRPWCDNTTSTGPFLNALCSFRIGPNDKAAYLIGNLIGFNGGTLSNIVTKTKSTFNTNTVALIGGIAGRDAGGKLDNVYAFTRFNGTSALFDDYITVQNPITEVASANAAFSIANVMAPLSLNLTVTTEGGGTTTVQLQKSTLSEAIPLVTNTYTVSLKDTIGKAYSQNEIDNDLVKDGDMYKLTYSGSDVSNKSLIVGGYTIYVQDISITPAICIITGCDEVSQVVYNFGKIANNQHSYSAVSAVDVDNDSISAIEPPSAIELFATKPTMQITYDVPYYIDSSHTTMSTATYIVTAELVDQFEIGVSAKRNATSNVYLPDIARDNYSKNYNAPTKKYADELTLRLFPILNIGGMFGEYIYSNGQSITNSRAELYADSFKNTAGLSGSCVKDFNIISLFASNIVFDSALKSNADFYRNTPIASADTNITNMLRCSVQTTDSAKIKQYYLRDCDDIISDGDSVSYAHYLHCYNQIAPALVTTNGALIRHRESTSRYPDIGIQYNDQLFFEVGLNMGPEYTVKDFSMDNFLRYSRCQTSAWHNCNLSGCYFNYPAQVSSCEAIDATTLNRYKSNFSKSYNAWFYNTIFDTVFDTGTSTANSTSYVSKQLLMQPSHYPLYRARASLLYDQYDYCYKTSIRLDDYEKVNIHAPVEVGTYDTENPQFGEESSIIKNAYNTLLSNLNALHPSESIPNYVYSYSSKALSFGKLKQIPVNVKYNPDFLTTADAALTTTGFIFLLTNDVWTSLVLATSMETAVTNAIATHEPSYKSYTISNESYKGVVDFGSISKTVDIVAAKNNVIELTGFDIIEHEHSTDILTLNFVCPSNYDIVLPVNSFKFVEGRLTKNTTPYSRQWLVTDYYRLYSTNNKAVFTVTNPFDEYHTVNDTYRNDRSITTVDYVFTANEHAANGQIIPHEMTATIDFNIHLEKEPAYQENAKDKYVPLSANSLVYGFTPVSSDIVEILNEDVSRTFNCTGLSADDMRYILLVDNQQRPILDISLDATACKNDGYIVKFDPELKNCKCVELSQSEDLYMGEFRYMEDQSCGKLINIENGNE